MTMGRTVFNAGFRQRVMGVIKDAAQYSPNGLEKQLKQEFGADSPLLTIENAGEQGACHVFVVAVAAQVTPAKPFLFRNWKESKTRNPLGTYEGRLWEAGRCTSAAPFYFPPYHHQPSGQHLDDGGIYRNNPTGLALTESEELWPGRRLGCIVSLGAGKRSNKAQKHSYGAKNSTWFRIKHCLGVALERAHVIVGMATESHETHLQVRQELKRDYRARSFEGKLTEGLYFRFDFDGVGDVDLVGR